MDHLSPPALTRSPTSPPNDLAYPSPPMMVEQQYKIASAYNSGTSCTLPPAYGSEISLPPVEAMGHPDWSSASGIHAASTSSSVPILSADYDPFQTPYDQGASAYYPQEVYQQPPPLPPPPHPHSASTAHIAHQAPSPPLDGRSRTPMPLTPRIKMESSEYPNPQDVSRYPSPPRSMTTPYSNEASHHYPAVTTSNYGIDAQQSAWVAPKSEYPHQPQSHQPQTSPMYPPPPPPPHHPSHPSAPAPGSDMAAQLFGDHRRLSRVSRQTARKQPRRMTTKEEATHQCDQCGKLFSRSYNHKAHMETHDKSRPYPFPCSVKDCNKKFVRRTDLQRHNASVHLKERCHKCEFCGRQFARKDTLRRHVDDGCSKRFSCPLDIGPESYDSFRGPPPGALMPPTTGSSLPPMTPPSGSGLVTTIAPPLRPGASWASR